jgi:hypothetical protein
MSNQLPTTLGFEQTYERIKSILAESRQTLAHPILGTVRRESSRCLPLRSHWSKKSTRPWTFQGLSIKATASLQSHSPLPAVPCGTVLQAPEGEHNNYRLSSWKNQAGFRPRPCKSDCRIAARSSGQTTCDTYIRFPVVGCLPVQTRSKRQNATVTTMSHFAQCLVRRSDTGSDASRNSWCHFSTGFGSVVDRGTTVTNC